MSQMIAVSRSSFALAFVICVPGTMLCSCSHSGLTVPDAGAAADAALPIPTRDLAAPAPVPDLTPPCDGAVCNGACVDTKSDPTNCGVCGRVCGEGQPCNAGICARPPKGPGLCFQDPPMGATLAPPPPKYKGTCPVLMPVAKGENILMSSGNARNFLLAVPAKIDPKEKLPVVFLWHWLGGSGNGFYTKAEVQAAVDQQRFIAVMPENKQVNGKSDLYWKWPFAITDSQARMDEEVQFFDDMYACVAAQFTINKECIGSVGVSAGALFTDQLAAVRADVLSSAMSLSGGTGGVARPWGNPKRALPMMVLWGGPTDICIVLNFQDASHNLEDALAKDGNFTLECVHNCGHGVPPFDPQMGLSTFAPLWQFVFDHPYWLPAGDSPYIKLGVPAGFPAWCEVGKGNATPRVGFCQAPGC